MRGVKRSMRFPKGDGVSKVLKWHLFSNLVRYRWNSYARLTLIGYKYAPERAASVAKDLIRSASSTATSFTLSAIFKLLLSVDDEGREE